MENTNRTINIINMRSRKFMNKLDGIHKNWINSLAFATNGKYLATRSGDSTVCLMEKKEFTIAQSFYKNELNLDQLENVLFILWKKS